MTRQSQHAMMIEKPPHDGHRRTILDPHATHVGIGLAWEKGEFRIAQEFVRGHPLPPDARFCQASAIAPAMRSEANCT